MNLSSFVDNSFDVVFSFETVEHLKEPEKFLDEVSRVLIPGGRFICSVPNLWVDETGNDPNPHHHHVFDYDRLKSLCEKYFLIEEAFSQVAGGGMKLTDSSRSIIKVDVTSGNPPAEAEWWLIVGMKDPLVGKKADYKETFYPTAKYKNLNVASWGRDYDNPWLFRALAHPGWRHKSKKGLLSLADQVLQCASHASPDKGAALCVLAYRHLEGMDVQGEQRDSLIEQLRLYIAAAEESRNANPHVIRWKISNQYVLAKLLQSAGQLKSAAEEFWKCSQMDFSGFCPLIATKVVDAAFNAGWLLLNAENDHVQAKKAWQHGIEVAKTAVTGPWNEVIGNLEQPFDFGLNEIAQVFDFANRCAIGLHHLQQMSSRPGTVASLISSCFAETPSIALIRKDQQLNERDQQLHEASMRLVELDQQLHQRNLQLIELDQQLHQRNLQLADQDQQLHQRNLQLIERDRQLEENAQAVAALNRQLTEQARKLAETAELVADRDQLLAEKDDLLNSILNSRSWRLTAPFRKLAEASKKET